MSDDTLRELKKISKILLLTNATVVEEELGKIAKSVDRKKMWVLIDGKNTSKEIADSIKVTQRAVQYFLQNAKAAEFIDYGENGAPRKVLDYVPPSWIELLTGQEPVEPQQKKSEEPKLEQFHQPEGKTNA